MLNKDLKKNAREELERTKERCQSQLKSTIKMIETFHISKLIAKDIVQDVTIHLEALSGASKEYDKEISEIKSNLQDFIIEVECLERQYEDNNDGSIAVADAVIGTGVVAIGSTSAVAIATTFGAASTGTAIATLSGATTTNAGLALLGGGALTAGGGGLAAGEALLTMAGPLGWTIGGLALLGGGFWVSSKNKEAAEQYEKTSTEIKETINELKKMKTAVEKKSIELNTLTQKLKIYDSAFEWMTEEVEFWADQFCKEVTIKKIMRYRPFKKLSSAEKDNLKSIINLTKAISEVLKEEINKG